MLSYSINYNIRLIFLNKLIINYLVNENNKKKKSIFRKTFYKKI